MPPKRRTNGADARAARALLFPELLAGAAHQLLVLGGMSTGPLPCAVMLHRFPEQVLVHRTEYLIGQFERTYLFAAEIYYINRCHVFFQLSVVSCQLSVPPVSLATACGY